MVKLALPILDERVEVSDSVCDFNSFGSLRVPGSCVGRVKAAERHVADTASSSSVPASAMQGMLPQRMLPSSSPEI